MERGRHNCVVIKFISPLRDFRFDLITVQYYCKITATEIIGCATPLRQGLCVTTRCARSGSMYVVYKFYVCVITHKLLMQIQQKICMVKITSLL